MASSWSHWRQISRMACWTSTWELSRPAGVELTFQFRPRPGQNWILDPRAKTRQVGTLHGADCRHAAWRPRPEGLGHSTVARRVMEWPLIVSALKPGKCWHQSKNGEAAGSRMTGWRVSLHPPKRLNGRFAKATEQSVTSPWGRFKYAFSPN